MARFNFRLERATSFDVLGVEAETGDLAMEQVLAKHAARPGEVVRVAAMVPANDPTWEGSPFPSDPSYAPPHVSNAALPADVHAKQVAAGKPTVSSDVAPRSNVPAIMTPQPEHPEWNVRIELLVHRDHVVPGPTAKEAAEQAVAAEQQRTDTEPGVVTILQPTWVAPTSESMPTSQPAG